MCEYCEGNPGVNGCEMCGCGRAEAIARVDRLRADRLVNYPRPVMEVSRELAAMRSEMTDANDRVFNALVFKKGDLANAKSHRQAVENRFDRLAQELEDARNLAG